MNEPIIEITEHFYTLTEATAELGIHRKTLWRWIKMGHLDAQKVGGSVFIEKWVIHYIREIRNAP